MQWRRKREKLALAQLKTKQVLQEQQLQRKLSELQFQKDMLEAKMEEERAKASVNVYEEFENQCRKSQYRERFRHRLWLSLSYLSHTNN